MFKKILVANRGEIAVRVMRTCREMGIGTVAVYSDADKTALHVLTADQAVPLGPAEPAQSYLNIEKIIAAAKETGAEAIHPGYGFLAENADFATAAADHGLAFIGPTPAAIRDLGDKTVARAIMEKGGVPVIPGAAVDGPDYEALKAHADAMGYPVLIKAAAGGGGKGMRVVESPDSFLASCEEAENEARAAFGNGTVYLEKCLVRPRHVEVQILADAYGNVIHLNERECSIQRRHQKIIEETPSPALNEELRQEMGAAAVAAAKASGYVNAGTVEFLLDQDGRFYFLEVNTRLQVEHPVTELCTGVDLVRKQIEIAAGRRLTLSQEDVAPRGHAIECRIYGEDPARDFLPSSGTIALYREPHGPGVRFDSGVYSGAEVPMEYDPIVAKLCVHAGSREAAIERMLRALADTVVLGVSTPVAYLRDVIGHPQFREGRTHTGFLTEHFGQWKPRDDHKDLAALAFVLDELSAAGRKKAGPAARAEAPGPFETLGHWRMG